VRMTIYLPDDLAKMVKAQVNLNVSKVCQGALEHELSRRKALAGGMERHVFRVNGYASVIPGVDLPKESSREVAFTAKEIASDTRATSQPWTAYLTIQGKIALWDDNGGLIVFPSVDDLRASDLSNSRPDVVAEIAKAYNQDCVIDLDIRWTTG
jgi:post-segregation antitoxin (ccd killing protein)